MDLSIYSIAQLKAALVNRNFLTAGRKIELIDRLLRHDPNIASKMPQEADVSPIGQDGPNEDEPTTACTATGPVLDSVMMRELELLRRERDLALLEVQVLRRELAVLMNHKSSSHDQLSPTRSTKPVTVPTPHVSDRSMSELIGEFHGKGNFDNWRRQIGLLRNSFHLDDNAVKIIICSRLKRSALEWFHSCPEHIGLSVDELLNRMEVMYGNRQSKLVLRKKFEVRQWRQSETFSDYYHEKVILANRVPVANDEMVDYLIDGISDYRLRDKAKTLQLENPENLLSAFQNISLSTRRGQIQESAIKTINQEITKIRSKKETPPGMRAARCFNCSGVGHISTQCTKPKVNRGCYRCGESDHYVKQCKEEYLDPNRTTNLVQSTKAPPPYMISLGFVSRDSDGCEYEHSLEAAIDSGSPVSIIKKSYAPSVGCDSPSADDHNYCEINGSKLRVLSIFVTNVKINMESVPIKFFVVPDYTMSYAALLGRDFISHPSLNVSLGNKVRITGNSRENETFHDAIDSLLHIDCIDTAMKCLDINPGIPTEVARDVQEIFEVEYSSKLQGRVMEGRYEMHIILKNNQPIPS